MPYSITTEDGITVDNIPDHLQPDAPELKQRVAQIRAVADANKPAAKPVEKISTLERVATGAADPVHAGAQLLTHVLPTGVVNAVNSANNWLADKTGLVAKVPEGGVDQMVRDRETEYQARRQASEAPTLSGLVTGQKPEPGFDWARLGGNVVSPANLVLGTRAAGAAEALVPAITRLFPALGRLGQALPMVATGAASGAAGGVATPVTDIPQGGSFAGEKASQVLGAGAAGGVLGPVAQKAGEVVAKGVRGITAAKPVAPTAEQVNVAMNNLFDSQGVKLQDVPKVVQDSVSRQLTEALTAGRKLDPAAMVRRAEAEAVGLTGDAGMTVGQASRNPIQLAQEKNLSGVVLDGPQGQYNPMADRINNQNIALQEVFKRAGAGGAVDNTTAGDKILRGLKDADVPVKQGVDAAYANARALAGGRAAELEREHFIRTANEALDQGQWGRYVPPEVRGMLNDIATGKSPFTVDAEVQIDSILSKAQRSAGQGSPQASAIGVIRDKLRETPMAQPKPPMQGAPSVAEQANAAGVVDNGVTDVPFREVTPTALPRPPSTELATEPVLPQTRQPGRALGPASPVPPTAAPPIDEGAAARQAFAEARQAARSRFARIEETPALKAALEDAAPDSFVRNYVLNADVRDIKAMQKVLEGNPEALGQARAQVAEHLRQAAFGANASGDKTFASERYLNTLKGIGKQKLEAFFTPEEVVQLNLAGKVASDLNSVPAGARYAVNSSGSGAAVFNLLSKIVDAVPGGKYVGGAARFLGNQAGQVQTAKQIQQALSGQLPREPVPLPPETLDMLRRLLPLSAAAGGTGAAYAGQDSAP